METNTHSTDALPLATLVQEWQRFFTAGHFDRGLAAAKSRDIHSSRLSFAGWPLEPGGATDY